MTLYKAFYLNGIELLAYTLDGTYSGEEQATKELLAYQNGVDVDSIKTNIIAKEENETQN